MKPLLYLLGGLTIASCAHADDAPPASAAPTPAPAVAPAPSTKTPPAPASSDTHGIGTGLSIGTTGFGLQIGVGLGDNFAVRGLASTFKYTHDGNLNGFAYDGNLKLGTAGVYGDWFPFSGVFRLTGGVIYNNSSIDISGKPSGGSYTINGDIYPSTSVNSVAGTMSFNKVAPYLGIGWGHLGRSGFNATADLGVLYLGRPDVSLSGQCGPSAGAACPTIQADIAAEQAKLQSDASKYRYFPVFSLGLGYTF